MGNNVVSWRHTRNVAFLPALVVGSSVQYAVPVFQPLFGVPQYVEKPLYFDPFGQIGFTTLGRDMIDPLKSR